MDPALISNITTVETVNTTFSIGNAAAIFERSNGTEMVLGACDYTNCTSVCLDLDRVFNSPATFLNCLSLPSLSSKIQNKSMWPGDQALVGGTFGIVEEIEPSRAIVANITGCFDGYVRSCQNNTVCNSAYRHLDVESTCQNFFASENDTRGTFPISSNGSFGTRDCIDAICSAITATANNDVVGIGVRVAGNIMPCSANTSQQVFISYFLQAGFALGVFAFSILWDFGLYYLLLCAFLYKKGYEKARERAFDLSERQSKHRDRLVPPLVEFHKTQCFFMFAVQVSAMASMKNKLFNATSLQQLQNNYCVIKVLAFGGFTPITFILLVLRMLHQNSWYMLFLSAATVGMSAATYFTASNLELSPKDISTQGTNYEGCGLTNPTSFCLSNGCSLYGSNHGLGQEGAFILSLVFILILFLEGCHVQRWTGMSKLCNLFLTRFGKLGKELLFGCLGFIISVLHFVYFGQYLQDLTIFARYSIGNVSYKYWGAVEIFNSSDWSFGQIVALIVWASPICEFMVLEIGELKCSRIESYTS